MVLPRPLRVLLPALALMLLFGVVVLIMFQITPVPRSRVDYLVIGAVATFVTMLALFVVLITTWARSTDVFCRRRKDRSE
jgi:hypothetical protein